VTTRILGTGRPPLAATRTGTDWCPGCELEAGTNRYRDQATGRERCASCAADLVATPNTVARVLITGSRTWTAVTTMRTELARWRQIHPGAVLVHGACRGADQIAAWIWSGWQLPVEPHPADWATFGRSAGFLRNRLMVDLGADVCLAFIRDHSRGAEHTAALAETAGIPTHRILWKDNT
jgi:hypothetical protein